MSTPRLTDALRRVLLCALAPAVLLAAAAPPTRAAEMAKMPAPVAKAVERGKEYLLRQHRGDGTFNGRHADEPGHTALCVYALRKAGVPSTEDVIQKAVPGLITYINSIGGRGDQKTIYNLGSVMLALQSLEYEQSAQRRVNAALKKGEQILRVRQRFDGGWGYGGVRTDLSVTQYAILGYWAARRSGVKLSDASLTKAAKFVMAHQEEGTYGGFRYRENTNVKPSMTGAGISSLAILYREATRQKIMREQPQYDSPGNAGAPKKKVAVADKPMPKNPILFAIERGFKWFHANGILYNHPYYLYSLERSCILTGTSKIGGDLDWYKQGSDLALQHQKPDGSWDDPHGGPSLGTAWMILFLARATHDLVYTDSIGEQWAPGSKDGKNKKQMAKAAPAAGGPVGPNAGLDDDKFEPKKSKGKFKVEIDTSRAASNPAARKLLDRALTLKTSGRTEPGDNLLRLLIKKYPDSSEAKEAREILGKK